MPDKINNNGNGEYRERFIERQKASGKVLVTTWIDVDAVKALDKVKEQKGVNNRGDAISKIIEERQLQIS